MAGELSASNAHEINQPLAAVVSNGDACLCWLRHEPPKMDGARDAAEQIVGSAMRAADVVKALRSLVSKKAAADKETLDVNKIIRWVIKFLAGELTEKHIELQLQLNPNLPAILGDEVQLRQVVLKLMLNGIEAMSMADSPLKKLMISSEESNTGEVTVAVRDSGPGIASKEFERIFEPFYSTKESGLGLGLSISRRIVVAHDGWLWTAGSKDSGATFHFTLPPKLLH